MSSLSQKPAGTADPFAGFHPVTAAWFQAVFDEPTAPQRMGWPVIARGEYALVLAPTGTGKTLAAFLWCLDRLMLEDRGQGTEGTREQENSSRRKNLRQGVLYQGTASQAAEKLATEGGGGFNPRIEPAKSTGPLGPEAQITAISHETRHFPEACSAVPKTPQDQSGAFAPEGIHKHQTRGCRIVYVSPLKALAVDVERNLRSPLAGMANMARRMGVAFHEPAISVRTGDTPQRERARFSRHPADILITTPESLYLLLTSRAADA